MTNSERELRDEQRAEQRFRRAHAKTLAEDALRQRLLLATHRCVAEHGFSATSTDTIAEGAGLSPGTLFRFYPTKAVLLRAALECARKALRGGGAPELEGDRVYDQLRALWHRAAHNALAAPAAFHYWRLYRATPLDTEWGFPAEMRLGPLAGVPMILGQATQPTQWNELSGWLAAAQWVAAVHFVLAPSRAPRFEPLQPVSSLSPSEVLDYAFESFWTGLNVDKSQPRVHYAYIW